MCEVPQRSDFGNSIDQCNNVPVPRTGAAKTATADDVVDAVIGASRALVGVSARSIAAHGEDVTIPQFRALVLLASRGPQRSVDLAALLDVTPSTTTRMCDRLIAKNLLQRQPATDDRRSVRLELTDGGADLVRSVSQSRRRDVARIMRRVPAADRGQLVRALRAFATAAGELPEQDWAMEWS